MIQGMYLNIINVVYIKFKDNIILYRKKLKRIPLKSGTSQYLCLRVSIAVMKHDEPPVGKEWVYLAYTSTLLFIIEGILERNSIRTGTWRQELM